mgnify:CR=1 FL=1
MIRNNDIIQGYTVLMVANGMVLAHSETAPDPYVVWHTAENGDDVYDGKYLPNKEDAEWDFCTKAFPWFEDNAPINIIEDNAAEKIDSFNWYLDGAKERVESCKSVLDEIQEAMDNASALVEDMVAEHEKLVGNEKAPPEESADSKIDYISDFDFEETVRISSTLSEQIPKFKSDSKPKQEPLLTQNFSGRGHRVVHVKIKKVTK